MKLIDFVDLFIFQSYLPSDIQMEQQLKAPPEIKKVAQFLRGGGAGMKIRVGALNGKRLDYFKGASFIHLLIHKWGTTPIVFFH
jgi:hypothetical protein